MERGHWEPRTLPSRRGGVVLGEMPGILQKTALPLLPKVSVRERNLQQVEKVRRNQRERASIYSKDPKDS